MANKFGFDLTSNKILKSISNVMKDGSIEAKNHFMKSFTDGGFTDQQLVKWQPRKKETAKTKGKGVLIASGALRRSIRVSQLSALSFTVVSDLGLPTNKDYAPVHNFGLRAGRGKGFIMPQRRFMGDSQVLQKKIYDNLVRQINKVF